ncbi:chemotaxis protein CheW [Phenylobacterium sp.]|uniref:chemotaxis protein CheW n=1 Tax=Phenylobacterium sp. TaxID=1871053 RepID=UPI0035AF00C1
MSDGGEAQYVTFGVGEETFAAPVSMVREILDYREAFKIPNGPAYLLGLTDVRGRGVPTVDLRVRLGLPRAEPTLQTRIVVLDVPVEGRVLSLGLVADRVHDVVAVQAAEIEPAPDIGVRWRSDYIAGVVRREAGFVVLVDIGRLFTSHEAVSLEAAADLTFAA